MLNFAGLMLRNLSCGIFKSFFVGGIFLLIWVSPLRAENLDLVITSEPQPGDKLGLPYADAVNSLDADVKDLLDGVLLLYKTPGLIGDRKKTLQAINAKVAKHNVFSSEESLVARYRDDLHNSGFLARPGWKGEYFYRGFDSRKNEWFVEVQIRQATSVAPCINSRAVEGYMDIEWHPLFSRSVHHPTVTKGQWNRHGVAGAIRAPPLLLTTPIVELGFVSGCLVQIDFGRSINMEVLSNDGILY